MAKKKLCPHCNAELIEHGEENPEKAGCWHCNECGCCFTADGALREGTVQCNPEALAHQYDATPREQELFGQITTINETLRGMGEQLAATNERLAALELLLPAVDVDETPEEPTDDGSAVKKEAEATAD